jgi:hypothetical protein
MTQYGSDGSHLSEMINWHLKQGWHIWYQLDYAQEVSVASPPESESHLGTPKILR